MLWRRFRWSVMVSAFILNFFKPCTTAIRKPIPRYRCYGLRGKGWDCYIYARVYTEYVMNMLVYGQLQHDPCFFVARTLEPLCPFGIRDKQPSHVAFLCISTWTTSPYFRDTASLQIIPRQEIHIFAATVKQFGGVYAVILQNYLLQKVFLLIMKV